MTEKRRENLHNVAIIAHVDHGKTTMIDQLLKGSGLFRDNQNVAERVMDSMDLEKEKGITIRSKNCSFEYKGNQVNIIDTPGHADFGGEVERIMKMVDGVLLLVDAFEGPMPQTKFVLKKALEANVKPIVVINKIDRPDGRPEEVVDMVFDLFVELGANDDQLDFPLVYASAKEGYAKNDLKDDNKDMTPILDILVDKVPSPICDADLPFQFLVTNLEYSDYLGRIAFGRIMRGRVQANSQVSYIKADGTQKKGKVTKIIGFHGLSQVDRDAAEAGDIIGIAGIEDIFIGETIADLEKPEALPVLEIDPPTITMTFMVNTSPFVGKEGSLLTARNLRERLYKEIQTNVSLRVEDGESPDKFQVSGRGEMQLGVLIETMRREGFELAVSKPEVILIKKDGKTLEPMENLVVDVDEAYVGTVMEKLGKRKAEMLNMHNFASHVRLEFTIPARGLLGLQSEFRTDTKGTGLLYHSFDEYAEYKGALETRNNGVFVSMENGETAGYSLYNLQDRGTLFVGPAVPVYEGMILGENSKAGDLAVNPCKGKKLTNMRAAGTDDNIKLIPPLIMSLEQALEYVSDDELLEITPRSLRLRKKFLKEHERKRSAKN